MSRMPGYIPPHLRPNYKPVVKEPIKPKPRGVHYKSNMSGLRTHNEKWHRYSLKKLSPNKPKHLKKLGSRKLRKSPIKSILKGKKKQQTRKIASANRIKPKRKNRTIKSK